MGMFQKIFGSSSVKPSLDYDRIIRSYGAVLESTAGESVSNQNTLPLPFEEMRPILLAAVSSQKDPLVREQLKVAFVSLGKFVKMSPAEQDAVEEIDHAMSDVVNVSKQKLAKVISDRGDVQLRLMNVVQAQMSGLMGELKRFGL